MILVVLYVSYLLYRRAGRVLTVSWSRTGNIVQWGALGLTAVVMPPGLGLGASS